MHWDALGCGDRSKPCRQRWDLHAACWEHCYEGPETGQPLHRRHAGSLVAPAVCREGKYCMRWPRAGQEQARWQAAGSFCRTVPS